MSQGKDLRKALPSSHLLPQSIDRSVTTRRVSRGSLLATMKWKAFPIQYSQPPHCDRAKEYVQHAPCPEATNTHARPSQRLELLSLRCCTVATRNCSANSVTSWALHQCCVFSLFITIGSSIRFPLLVSALSLCADMSCGSQLHFQ